jgi:DNA replicative helicase MCM subunit Mcm2 (Cdc46/Mcm family)
MEYDREQYYQIPSPVKCSRDEFCNSVKFEKLGEAKVKDFQEIKVQEQVHQLSLGTIPRSITVILEDDLVDSVKPGDDVKVLGVVISQWKKPKQSDRCDLQISLVANSVRVVKQSIYCSLTDDLAPRFRKHWSHPDQIEQRNIIVNAVCPQIAGLFHVKLAILLILIGGVAKDHNNVRIRGDSHLLLVGDPGMGKSQFLRYAMSVSRRGIFTTGIGSTNAGLTVAATKEGGEWSLEAGALVLADRGICCIDEFGSIRESDKTSIHEAMEQQSISVAKAGMVCKLNSRCSIIGATNPKGKYDPRMPLDVNLALGSPLLSRFDLILVLVDKRDDTTDKRLTEHILGFQSADESTTTTINECFGDDQLTFDQQQMQAYIAYCQRLNPTLTQDARTVLSKYYQLQRKTDSIKNARTTIRLLESLIR